jgi:hypothetical protein
LERVWDTGAQVGVASVPLVVVLTVLGAWAERACERSIDLVGVWTDPPVTALGIASVRINVRNGSELPVTVEELAFELRSKWELPPVKVGKSDDLYANLHIGTPHQFFIGDIGHVPPRETRSKEYKVDLATIAPESSRSLYHVWSVVERVGLVDGAGRRWWVHPNRGDRAKRIYGEFGRNWKPPWPNGPGRRIEVLEIPSIARYDGDGDSAVRPVND